MDGDLITKGDLSKLLRGRSSASLYRDVKRGTLPRPLKLGGVLYWSKSEVADHLQQLRKDQMSE